MDVFMPGVTPENLWVPGYRATSIAAGENVETADIFDTAMKNGFTVSRTIIRAALNGGFGI